MIVKAPVARVRSGLKRSRERRLASVVLASNNAGKLREFAALLARPASN